jgi:hypothetical protein
LNEAFYRVARDHQTLAHPDVRDASFVNKSPHLLFARTHHCRRLLGRSQHRKIALIEGWSAPRHDHRRFPTGCTKWCWTLDSSMQLRMQRTISEKEKSACLGI